MRVQADFTEAAQASDIRPVHVEDGDYRMVVKSAELTEVKSGENKGKKQIMWVLSSPQIRGAAYPYYTALTGKSSWKLRVFLEATGTKIAKDKLAFDTDRIIGRELGAELVEDEYQGKLKSVVNAVFPVDELNDSPAVENQTKVNKQQDDEGEPDTEEDSVPEIPEDDVDLDEV